MEGARTRPWFARTIFVIASDHGLPILPLDGGRIAVSLLPRSIAMSYARLEPYGFMVVILLLATGILNMLMAPLVRFGLVALNAIVGL